jgi:hypothetical protein
MSLSESFDSQPIESQFFVSSSEQSLESAFPLRDLGGEVKGIDKLNWHQHLLPMPCIAAEDSLAVLRAELEKAHALLQQQHKAIDGLKEQLTNRELQIQHLQCELVDVQQRCDRQSTKLVEADGICSGLKTQLRRQQQRVLQYRNLLNEHLSQAVSPFSAQEPVFSGERLGERESTREVSSSASRSSSVSAWSAPHSIGLTGPLACYRELATIRMTSTLQNSQSLSSQTHQASQETRIELPTFSTTHSL